MKQAVVTIKYDEEKLNAVCNQKGKPPAGQKQCGIRQCRGE